MDINRGFPGFPCTTIDDKLEYIPGHTIDNRYRDYKGANRAASGENKAYSSTAKALRKPRPWDPADPVAVVEQQGYTASGHRTLEPLAGNASSAQKVHADKRERFNHDYRDLLTVKGKYKSHVDEANAATANAAYWTGIQQQHRYGSGGQYSGSLYGGGQYSGDQPSGVSYYGAGPSSSGQSSSGRYGGSQYGGSQYGGSQYGGGPSSGGHYGSGRHGSSQRR